MPSSLQAKYLRTDLLGRQAESFQAADDARQHLRRPANVDEAIGDVGDESLQRIGLEPAVTSDMPAGGLGQQVIDADALVRCKLVQLPPEDEGALVVGAIEHLDVKAVGR